MSLPFEFTAEDVISQGRTSRENVDTIRTWLNNGEDCVPKNLPDEMVVIFLLACEDDVEFTKTTIKLHYKLKIECSALHDNRNAHGEDIERVFNMWTIATLPVRTEDNYAIHYFKLNDNDYKKYDMTVVLKVTLMLIDVTLEKNPPDGFITITDMSAATLMHITTLKFDIIMKYFHFVQEALHMKIKSMHYLNSNFVLNKVMGLVKRFIKGDVLNRMHFHPPNVDLDKLYEHIPRKCLPSDFGGDLPSLAELSSNTYQQFKSRQKFWNLEEKLREK